MDEIELALTDDEFILVSKMPCENAAVEICKIHFRRTDPSAHFSSPGNGADLRVRRGSGLELDLEVKGTESLGIAWAQLKVSSQQSHDRLAKGMPIYRVTGVRARAVKIFILRYGIDFEMSHEPRWRVHPPRR